MNGRWRKVILAPSVDAGAQGLFANAPKGLAGITMQNLRLQLEANYAQHPSFQCGRPALVLDATAFSDRFSAPYKLAREFGPRLTRAQRAAGQQQCLNALADVFGGLICRRKRPMRMNGRFWKSCTGNAGACCWRMKSFCSTTLRDSVSFVNPQNQRDVLQLAHDRCYFGRLSPSVSQELLALGSGELGRCRENARHGRLTRADLSANSGPAVRRIMAVLNREFRALGVLDAVRAYAGSRMTVTAVALELSVPQATWWGNFLEPLERPPKTRMPIWMNPLRVQNPSST